MIPIPIVILLAITVVCGVWWGETRKMDFASPPSEPELAKIRQKVESSFARIEDLKEEEAAAVVEEPPAPMPPLPVKPIDLGDLKSPPGLKDYGVLSVQGADHLIKLATALEEHGAFQRALLAWERVIDSAPADQSQAATAITASRRLRPTLPDWNTDAGNTIQIVLHAGTAKSLAKKLTPVLEDLAREIEFASSGIVKVTVKVTAGKTTQLKKESPPVALWLAGSAKKSPSTEVLSYTFDSPAAMKSEAEKTVYHLIRNQLGRMSGYRLPLEFSAASDASDAFAHQITRLHWQEFAHTLNATEKTNQN